MLVFAPKLGLFYSERYEMKLHKHAETIAQFNAMVQAGCDPQEIVQLQNHAEKWESVPWVCWLPAARYRVAVGKIEGRYAFEGDRYYNTECGGYVLLTTNTRHHFLAHGTLDHLTWAAPKSMPVIDPAFITTQEHKSVAFEWLRRLSINCLTQHAGENAAILLHELIRTDREIAVQRLAEQRIYCLRNPSEEAYQRGFEDAKLKAIAHFEKSPANAEFFRNDIQEEIADLKPN